MELRPLSLGEIFNRAILLYLRNFRAFFAIVLVTVVPLALVEYFVTLAAQPEIEATLRSLSQPQPVHGAHAPTLLDSPGALTITLVSVLLSYFLLAVAVSAVGAGVARIYRAEPVFPAACYAAVLARLVPIVELLIAALAVLLVCYVALILIATIPLVLGALFAPVLPLLTLVATTILLFAMTFCIVMLLVAGTCAFFGVVVEDQPASAALRSTVSRIFNRNEFGRTVLCALAVGTIVFAGSVLAQAAFFALARWTAAYVAADAIARSLLIPFVAIVLSVYYFDVRIRHEGFDLEAPSDEPAYAPTAYLSGEERVLIKRFLERRESLAVQRRRQIAARLAEPVRARVPEELRRLDDESLLERL
ncbi:MAG TPA: hypothetical protein VFF63_02400 [Candidatus Babeliales bacterium]|nr:hypothetical protein [Candidatus Babeliales bacterium]